MKCMLVIPCFEPSESVLPFLMQFKPGVFIFVTSALSFRGNQFLCRKRFVFFKGRQNEKRGEICVGVCYQLSFI